jgi:L-threonylcarbamoyladenylate synthase
MRNVSVKEAAEWLSLGELVAIPTETVYGLAAHALDAKAVAQIFAVKNRPANNPLILHVGEMEQIRDYVKQVPEEAWLLLRKFSPGPLTLVLPKRDIVPDITTASRPDLAIRIPSHPVSLELLRQIPFPLAAPSANPSGYISPTSADHVRKMLEGKIKYLLDGGPCQVGMESTIIGFTAGRPNLFREGMITRLELEKVIGPISEYEGQEIKSPGMAKMHYSPHTPLVLHDDPDELLVNLLDKRVGLITYNHYSELLPFAQQALLCENDQYRTAASRLYKTLHEMDEQDYELLIAKRFPNNEIGKVLNDRLARASARFPDFPEQL